MKKPTVYQCLVVPMLAAILTLLAVQTYCTSRTANEVQDGFRELLQTLGRKR